MTNRQFVIFCKAAKDKPCKYMWGTYGTTHNKTHIDEDIIASKARQYPSHYDTKYQAELRSCIGTHIGCDCTGLIKWFLWTGGDIDKAPKYTPSTDRSASGWYETATVRGTISTMPERAGLILSFKGHCGVYIGNGKVIECTKGEFGNGVVETKITDRKWVYWCECKNIDYTPELVKSSEIALISARMLKETPAYASLNGRHRVGEVYKDEIVQYIGGYGGAAAIIYQTSATQKIAFVDIGNIVF